MHTTQQLTTGFIMFALLATGLFMATPSASAHEGHDHEAEPITQEARIVMMEEMVKLLTKLKELLEEKVEMKNGTLYEHEDEHEHASLSISVEEHGGVTHVHVNETGKPENNFFLEDIDLSERDEIIAAIAKRIDMTEAEVKAIATFKGDVHSEEVAGSHADMDGLEGIHIMTDGTVMLGNGKTLTDATINDEGMIVLGDGTLVEPTADMR